MPRDRTASRSTAARLKYRPPALTSNPTCFAKSLEEALLNLRFTIYDLRFAVIPTRRERRLLKRRMEWPGSLWLLAPILAHLAPLCGHSPGFPWMLPATAPNTSPGRGPKTPSRHGRNPPSLRHAESAAGTVPSHR